MTTPAPDRSARRPLRRLLTAALLTLPCAAAVAQTTATPSAPHGKTTSELLLVLGVVLVVIGICMGIYKKRRR